MVTEIRVASDWIASVSDEIKFHAFRAAMLLIVADVVVTEPLKLLTATAGFWVRLDSSYAERFGTQSQTPSRTVFPRRAVTTGPVMYRSAWLKFCAAVPVTRRAFAPLRTFVVSCEMLARVVVIPAVTSHPRNHRSNLRFGQ